MAKQLQLQIPSPCHENWENMSQVEKGRFCASCEKKVIDFSYMSDREIALFFKKPTGSVCGRFFENQLNRDIDIPKKRIPWIKYFVRFALPAFLVSCGARMQGKVKIDKSKTDVVIESTCQTLTLGVILPPEIASKKQAIPTQEMIIDETKNQQETNSDSPMATGFLTGDTLIRKEMPTSAKKEDAVNATIIKGKIIDDEEVGVPFATLAIKGTSEGAAADSTGTFSMNLKSKWDSITLVASCVGFSPTEIYLKKTDSVSNLVIRLNPHRNLGLVTVVSPVETFRKGMVCGSIRTIQPSGKISKPLAPIGVKVFSNPVQSKSSMNIEWSQKEQGTFSVQLYNSSGQLVLKKEVYVDEQARLFTIDIPSITAGTYFLRITSKTNGRSYTEKIIIVGS